MLCVAGAGLGSAGGGATNGAGDPQLLPQSPAGTQPQPHLHSTVQERHLRAIPSTPGLPGCCV